MMDNLLDDARNQIQYRFVPAGNKTKTSVGTRPLEF